MPIQKIKSGRVINVTVGTYVGLQGNIFYDEDIGELRLSDGVTPGGVPITNSGTSITALANLTDVDIITTPPLDGQALIYSTGTSKWIAGNVASTGTAIFGNLDGGDPNSNYGGITAIDAGSVV